MTDVTDVTDVTVPPPPVPRPAAVYGAAGLIPFVAAAVAVWVLPGGWKTNALYVQLAYGATILSFLGAVHWGLALAGRGTGGDVAAACTWRRLGLSVVPALIGWVSLTLAPLLGALVQLVAFAGLMLADGAATRQGLLPPWYPRVRKPLTLVVMLSLAAAIARASWPNSL